MTPLQIVSEQPIIIKIDVAAIVKDSVNYYTKVMYARVLHSSNNIPITLWCTLTRARWPWNHAMIAAITGHHACVWALTNAHLTLKVCFFSNVKAFWVPCILDRDDFFYLFHSQLASYQKD